MGLDIVAGLCLSLPAVSIDVKHSGTGAEMGFCPCEISGYTTGHDPSWAYDSQWQI